MGCTAALKAAAGESPVPGEGASVGMWCSRPREAWWDGTPLPRGGSIGLAKVVLPIHIIPQPLSIPPRALLTCTVSPKGVGAWGKRSHDSRWGRPPGHAVLGRRVQLRAGARPALRPGPAAAAAVARRPLILSVRAPYPNASLLRDAPF